MLLLYRCYLLLLSPSLASSPPMTGLDRQRHSTLPATVQPKHEDPLETSGNIIWNAAIASMLLKSRPIWRLSPI